MDNIDLIGECFENYHSCINSKAIANRNLDCSNLNIIIFNYLR